MMIENTCENIAYKLEQLAELYRHGYASEIMLKTLQKLFIYETEMCRSQLGQLRNDLSDFEKQYDMNSEVFYQHFQKGKTDDRMDFVEWASLVQMAYRLEKQLELLKSRRMTAFDGHIRVRMTLINGDLMEFSEYVQRLEGGIQVVTYSYHCTDSSGNLIVRWDNTPHFPDLDGFPHHKHIGCSETVQAGYPMTIFRVLDEIGACQQNPGHFCS